MTKIKLEAVVHRFQTINFNKKIRRVHYSTKKHRQTLKTQHYLTVLTIYLTANKSERRCIFSFFNSIDG